MYDVFNTYSSKVVSKESSGKISVNASVKGTILGETFLPFNGINVSNSAGKKVHFIAFNNTYYNDTDNALLPTRKYSYAETIYHEIYTHIDQHDNATSIGQYLRKTFGAIFLNADIEHGIYGSDSDHSINKYAKPEKNPYEKINNELYDIMMHDLKTKSKK